VNSTTAGKSITENDGPLIQPYLSCCAANIWFPLHHAMVEMGIERIMRGTRLEDRRKSSVRNGDIVNGMQIVHPIENWTTEQVFDYLDENKVRIENLPEERKAEVKRRLGLIGDAIRKQWHEVI
jgi:phosphoadenosine phosphosulfate reductase